jgi:hypothetical protein
MYFELRLFELVVIPRSCMKCLPFSSVNAHHKLHSNRRKHGDNEEMIVDIKFNIEEEYLIITFREYL